MTTREAITALESKGFTETPKGGGRRGGRDHKYYFFYYQGKKTSCYTYFSHGSKSQDIGDGLLQRMKPELHLDTMQDVRELYECPLTEEKLVEKLKAKNLLQLKSDEATSSETKQSKGWNNKKHRRG